MAYKFPETLLLLLRRTSTSNALLAREIGTSGTTVQNWIEDKTSPKISTAFKIADYFGVNMNELCGLTELNDERISEIQKAHTAKYGNTKRVELVPADMTDKQREEFGELMAMAREELAGEKGEDDG